MNLNVKTVKLFNNEKEFLISERTAGDVVSFAEFSEKLENTQTNSLYKAIVIIEAGLKINFSKIKFYQLFKRLYLKRVLNQKYLINNLSALQISELAKEILILEGFNFDNTEVPKKKVE